MEAASLAQVDTIYSADSIEFCPLPGLEKWFTCGTYQLLKPGTEELAAAPGAAPAAESEDATKGESSEGEEEEEEKPTEAAPRIGRLYLYSLEDETPREVQRLDTAAILDVKWSPHSRELGVADAKGGLALYPFDPDTGLSQTERLQLTDEDKLVLSLDYATATSRRGELVASLSSGSVAHIVRSETGLEVASEWAAHDFEPWITAWGHEADTVWSGGDDCKLKRWDLRMPGTATAVNRRFEGGVTTIAPSPHTEHLLAVGSYDAHLRLFDARQPARPLQEVELPGGIWRTRWHPSASRKADILNACMHGGFAVVRVDTALDSMAKAEVIKTFPGTLGYGADWHRGEDGLVATCSFYDHVMNVWRA